MRTNTVGRNQGLGHSEDSIIPRRPYSLRAPMAWLDAAASPDLPVQRSALELRAFLERLPLVFPRRVQARVRTGRRSLAWLLNACVGARSTLFSEFQQHAARVVEVEDADTSPARTHRRFGLRALSGG